MSLNIKKRSLLLRFFGLYVLLLNKAISLIFGVILIILGVYDFSIFWLG